MSPNEPLGLPEEERPHRAAERRQGLRFRGSFGWFALGVAIALVLGAGFIALLTQTDRGRSQVLAFTLRALGGRLSGELEIERIEGNLLTGARFYGLRLSDFDGVPLAIADSGFIRYRAASFVGGDIIINRLELYGGHIHLYRMPDDSLWNYQKVLQDPTPGPPDPTPGATLIEELGLRSTRITIRSPFAPDADLGPERQQLALEEALADTARWVLEEVPGGYLRTMTVDVDRADVVELFISPDERDGTYLEVLDAGADVRLWREPPLEIRGLEAALHLQEGILNFRAPAFALPGTRGDAVGRIDLNGSRPMYDVVLTLPAFTLADLRWLYPWLPEEPAGGRGSARVWIEDRPEELLVVARDLDLQLPGTRISGRFGLLTGDTPRFVDVDLEADPLDLASVERLLPEGLPVEGLDIEAATIRGD